MRAGARNAVVASGSSATHVPANPRPAMVDKGTMTDDDPSPNTWREYFDNTLNPHANEPERPFIERECSKTLPPGKYYKTVPWPVVAECVPPGYKHPSWNGQSFKPGEHFEAYMWVPKKPMPWDAMLKPGWEEEYGWGSAEKAQEAARLRAMGKRVPPDFFEPAAGTETAESTTTMPPPPRPTSSDENAPDTALPTGNIPSDAAPTVTAPDVEMADASAPAIESTAESSTELISKDEPEHAMDVDKPEESLPQPDNKQDELPELLQAPATTIPNDDAAVNPVSSPQEEDKEDKPSITEAHSPSETSTADPESSIQPSELEPKSASSTGSTRPHNLHVTLPPVPSFSGVSTLSPTANPLTNPLALASPSNTTPGFFTGSSMAQSPMSTTLTHGGLMSPAIQSAVAPSPAKKKMSLSDYTKRKKAEATSVPMAPMASLLSSSSDLDKAIISEGENEGEKEKGDDDAAKSEAG